MQQTETTMAPDPNDNLHLQSLIEAQEQRILALEKQLTETEKKSKSYESDWSKLFDQAKTLREEKQMLQRQYEDLRIQKGGFGFKMLMFSGFAGFVSACILCFVYLKLKPKPDHVVVFEKFKREQLFNFELQLSRGDFDGVEISLEKLGHTPEYAAIIPHIQFTEKVVGAAKRYCKPPQ
ncbi:MAG: hypothetical protein JNJ57_16160 [Saprospiraceae bacterium]|nr:hypothetical protein [Saprospiraceae bacterium]